MPSATDMEKPKEEEDTGKDTTEPGKKPRKPKAQAKPKPNAGTGRGKGGDENKPPKAKTPEQEAKTVTWLDPFFATILCVAKPLFISNAGRFLFLRL